MKLYAQFTDGVCTFVGTPNITGIEATYENLGQEHADGNWVDVEETEEDLEMKIASLQHELDEAVEQLGKIQKGGVDLELGKGKENK